MAKHAQQLGTVRGLPLTMNFAALRLGLLGSALLVLGAGCGSSDVVDDGSDPSEEGALTDATNTPLLSLNANIWLVDDSSDADPQGCVVFPVLGLANGTATFELRSDTLQVRDPAHGTCDPSPAPRGTRWRLKETAPQEGFAAMCGAKFYAATASGPQPGTTEILLVVDARAKGCEGSRFTVVATIMDQNGAPLSKATFRESHYDSAAGSAN